jgi:hypothetical protein
MSTNFYIGSTPVYQQYLGNTYGKMILGEGIDEDVLTYTDFVGITNTSVIESLDTFVKGLKGDGIWNRMVQIYPFVGDTSTDLTQSFVTNLKDISTYSGSYIGSFNGDLDGWQSIRRGDNDGDVINTKLNPSTVWSNTNDGASVAIYTKNGGVSGDAWDWGVFDNINSFVITGRNLSGGNSQKFTKLISDNEISVTNTSEGGCFVSVTSASLSPNIIMDLNQTAIASANVTSYEVADAEAYFGANHRTYLFDAENQPTGKKYQFLSVGYGLDTTQMDSFAGHIQQLQEDLDTSLGTSRAVTL